MRFCDSPVYLREGGLSRKQASFGEALKIRKILRKNR
jgi:hypothetical protein